MLVGYVLLASLDRGHAQATAQDAPVASVPTVGTTQIVLLVNPTVGNDAVADGSDRAPFKTITQALQVAPVGAVILLTSGTYSQETGETFPLRLKPDVTVQGNTETRGQDIVIQGSGFFLSPTFARQKVAIVGADRALLAGVTVKNPDPQGYGVWIESTSPAVVDSTFTESGHDGISVTGNGSPLIRNNYFYQNGANGMTIYGTSRAEVRENIFEQTGFAINVNQKAAPLLIGNRITQNKDGIVVQASAQPVLRNNSVDGNTRDGLVAIAQSRPDLGTAAAPGGNSFRNNGQFDVNTKSSSQPIPAFGNDLDKTSGTLDLAGTSLGSPASSTAPLMPWSSSAEPPQVASRSVALSALPQSPVSADKATAGGGKTLMRVQKQIPVSLVAATSQTAADTIPFGQRLVSDRAVEGDAQTVPPESQQSTATLASKPANSISAASFPVPVVQSSVSASRPMLPLVTVTSASSSSESGFPVPLELPGTVTTALSPRPMQLVRIAIAPQLLLQGSAEANRAFPTVAVRPSPRPFLPIASSASAITSPIKLAPLPALKPSLSPSKSAIEISVPAPEQRSTPAPVRSVAAVPAIASTQPIPIASVSLLPVPSPDAPIGNVGSASIVYRTRENPSRVAPGLRYRVVVVPGDDSQQAQLRAAFPNAFRTSVKGLTLMQVGAFGDRTKADQLMQTLSSQGIQATVETLE